MRRLHELVGRAIRGHRFALAAFLIPLSIRAVPEILVGPYPVGWDTIAFYVPNTLDWAAGKVGLLEMLGTAPLMYMISVPLYGLLRADPVWVFKIMGPLLYGSMFWALFRFLGSGLGWSGRLSLGGVLVGSLYFVSLRVSWDMYRLMMGLVFVLLALPLLNKEMGPRKQALLSALIVLAVASDQLTGVIILVLLGARALAQARGGELNELAKWAKIATPGATLFLLIVYAGNIASGIGLVQTQPPVPSMDGTSSSIGFLVFAYLPLAPLILIGARKVANRDLRNWSLFCVAAALTALVPFFGLVVMSYRWSLLLTIPFCVYATAGLANLRIPSIPTMRLSRLLSKTVLPAFVLLLVGSAVLYIALPAQSAFVYYAAYPALLPTSMVQDTVPLSDMDSLVELMRWAASNSDSQTALITHQAIYGWARAYFPASERIVNYGYSSPLVGVEEARLDGYASTLMIWWVTGLGWHGQPIVPAGFVPVVRDGNLAVYAYY